MDWFWTLCQWIGFVVIASCVGWLIWFAWFFIGEVWRESRYNARIYANWKKQWGKE